VLAKRKKERNENQNQLDNILKQVNKLNDEIYIQTICQEKLEYKLDMTNLEIQNHISKI